MTRQELNAIRLRELVLVPVEKRCAENGLLEYRFHPTRLWRFDAAWGYVRVALEVEGAVMRYRRGRDGSREYVGGRHTRGAGAVADMEKYNAAATAGWCVIRCTWDDVDRGEAAKLVIAAILARKGSARC